MSKTAEFWFRQWYKLAPTDPRYLDATPEQIAVEYWACFYFNNPKAVETVVDEEYSRDEIMRDMEQNPGDWEDVSGEPGN